MIEREQRRVVGSPVEDLEEDRSSAQDLYERFGGEVYGFLLGLLGERNLAEDVLQETFVKVLRQESGVIESLENPRAWLYAVARRCAYDWMRGDQRRRARNAELRRTSATLAALVTADRGWKALAESERRTLVEQCLCALPQDQRELLLLAVQDLSYREIASVVGCSHPTAKKRIREALTALTRALQARRIFEEGDL